MSLRSIVVPGWKTPKGYSNGMLAPSGSRLLAIAGQVAWDAEERIVGPGVFPLQFRQALSNVLDIVRAAGGKPEQLMQLTVFVTDVAQYSKCLKELVGRHYPAMALVQVAALLEEGALVEIQGLAAIAAEERDGA